ncbi:MAG: hypothetical protein LBQ49_01700 [Rickettsiales bacterium]|jgi:beta-phosphoglucomutase-like phosphatase (HAD superfamily)|nr:hypothetical protein [Rickettsiales bacterium]
MKIILDCDEVIIENTMTAKAAYLALVDPSADIPDYTYPSRWPVFGSDPDGRKKFEDFFQIYRNSEYYVKAPPMPGAIEGIRALKSQGHDLHVITAVGGQDDSGAQDRRREYLESLVGKNVFTKITHVAMFESKKDLMAKIGAEVLVDDGSANITAALELGMRGIWFRFRANKYIIDRVMSGDDGNRDSFWTYDAKLLREKAVVADGWEEVVRIINNWQIAGSKLSSPPSEGWP